MMSHTVVGFIGAIVGFYLGYNWIAIYQRIKKWIGRKVA